MVYGNGNGAVNIWEEYLTRPCIKNDDLKRFVNFFVNVLTPEPEEYTAEWIFFHEKNVEKGVIKSAIILGDFYFSRVKSSDINDLRKSTKFYSIATDDDRYRIKALGQLIKLCFLAKDFDSLHKFLGAYRYEQSSDANFILSYVYAEGYGVEPSKDKFFQYLSDASMTGNARALYLIGNCYFYGYVVGQNFKTALKCYELSAQKNNHSAEYCVGLIYLTGLSGDISQVKAKEYLQRSAMSGHSGAEFLLGKLQVPYNERGYENWLYLSASNGNAESINLLSKNIVKQPAVQFYLYATAATMGCAKAITNMALMKDKSIFLPFSYVDSNSLLQTAANRGDPNAVCALAQNLRGTAKLNALKTAAQGGSAMAFNLLGEMYLYGDSVDRSVTNAIRLFSKAAKQNCAEAYLNLGNMFNEGIGVEISKQKAKEYYARASELGSWDARGKILGQTFEDCFNELGRIFENADKKINKILG